MYVYINVVSFLTRRLHNAIPEVRSFIFRITYVNNYGTSGDVAKIVAGKKVYKYGETCDELGYDLIPFAIETYVRVRPGKFGKAALKHLKVLQTMALEEGVR